jgi:dipeptidyl aminopeptidase/acylaminoacyl peptidase
MLRGLLILSSVLAGSILVGFFGPWGTSSTPWEPSPGLPIDALAETVWIEEFHVSPDGELIAFKSGGNYDLWTVPTAGGEPTRITDLGGRALAPSFSPDGRWIAFETDFGGTEVRSPSDSPIIP